MTRNNIVASIRHINDGITQSLNHGINKGITTSLFALLILTHSISAYSQPSEESIYQVQRLYVAYFGRPGLPEGLEYWANRIDEGEEIQTIAEAFGGSAEYFNKHAQEGSWTLVYSLYHQMFNRDPESAGLTYFRDLLGTETVSFISLPMEIANAAINVDFLALENKIFVANEFSSLIPIDGDDYIDMLGATELLATVTGDPETVDSALEQLTNFILDASFNPGYRIIFRGGSGLAGNYRECAENYCVNSGKTIEVIRVQSHLENPIAAYSQDRYLAPNIDFHNNFVLLYDMGVKSSGGWGAHVTSVENLENATKINIEIFTPSTCPGRAVTQAFTHPFYFIEVDRFIINDGDYHPSQDIWVNESMATCPL